MNPLVSIITAAYNSRPDHLATAIRSALCQTWEEVEIIISDDSADESLRAVVDQFADPRIRYRHNSPGLGVARNHWACLRQSRGEYVAVLNHDDWLAPTFVERLAAPLKEDAGLSLSFCDHWIIDADGKACIVRRRRPLSPGGGHGCRGVHRPFYELLASQTIAMGTLFRRKLLPDLLSDYAGPAYDLWLTYSPCAGRSWSVLHPRSAKRLAGTRGQSDQPGWRGLVFRSR